MPAADVADARLLRVEHDAMLPVIERIRSVADGLSTRECDLTPARSLLNRLETELLPHERADEELLVPLVDRALGGGIDQHRVHLGAGFDIDDADLLALGREMLRVARKQRSAAA